MVDVNTVVGSPVLLGNDTMILPVSKVTLGFITGGGEYMSERNVKNCGEALDEESRFPFAGSVATAMVITPMAFLSVNGGTVNVHTTKYDCTLDRLIHAAPDMITRIVDKFCCKCDENSGDEQ